MNILVDVRFPFYVLILLLHEISVINCQSSSSCQCNTRAHSPGTSTSTPEGCASASCQPFRTLTTYTRNGNNYVIGGSSLAPIQQRTNSIQDFCIFADIYEAGKTAKTPEPLGYAGKDCYPFPPPSGASASLHHSAGPDPNWAILEHLTQHYAQSFQLYDDLPFVHPFLYEKGDTFIELDPINKPDPLPDKLAPNPYFVEVTGISVKGELLQNFLHFRIFANLSVALGTDQILRDKVLHGRNEQGPEAPNYATGKISALLIMVKDQDGWPIGDFSVPVPCSRTCSRYSHDVYYGDERNAVPCSYTPPFASTHPGMFVFDVDPGRYCTMPAPNTTAPPAAPNANPPDPRQSAHSARLEGVREVHATWSFGHNTCNFVQRIYIQTLIFEDVETVYKANLGKDPSGTAGVFDKWVLFGWSAQYNILKTTRGTLGAPDYVDLKYLRERDSRANEIDCHVPLFDSEENVKSSFEKFLVPSVKHMDDTAATRSPDDVKVPSRLGYLGLLSHSFEANKNLRYFGQHAPKYPSATTGASTPMCRPLPTPFLLSNNDVKDHGDGKPLALHDFLLNDRNLGVRCPCPALASTLPPENRTADPARLYGRLIHASHMAIAYMLLTPIGCFVARYYKETFITVFCFQEYWWYMWHVVTLIAACLFNVGAITSIARKKDVELVYNDNLTVHIIFGAVSIFIFYMEIITGFFRVADPKKRMRQIFMHWLIGVTNNACAVMSMYAMAWVDQSGFSCNVAYTVTFWLIFVIVCYVIMEMNMRKTDKKLRLVPRRTYLPPPVKRLFTKEPPGRMFRLIMLAIFIFGLLIIQFFVSYHIWDIEGAASCEEEYRMQYAKIGKFEDLPDAEDESGGGGDDDDSY